MTPAVKRKRRQDSRQTEFEFRSAGRGGARPGAGRRRTRRSRVPHRTREAIPRRCPVLVTLRVQDDVPALRRARFVRAFRESLRKAAERPGFRVVHYSIQNDHAHFLVEADDKISLANGMKSLGARFARCVNRVCQRAGRVLATRFHHVLKRTPTEVRNALAYVLLNARQRYGVLKCLLFLLLRSSWSLVDPTNDHLPVGEQKASPSSRHGNRSGKPVRGSVKPR